MDVSGLEISSKYIRAIKVGRVGSSLKVIKIAEVQLPEGIVNNGKIEDAAQFSSSLSNFLKSNKFNSSHWIVTIPENLVYTAYKTFPNLSSEDLGQAVDINANSFLPGDRSDISWGWQEIQTTSKNSGKEVMISSISRNNLNAYLEAFTTIGVVPVAIEPRSASVARVFGSTSNTLVLNIEGDTLCSVIINQGFSRFAREYQISTDEKDAIKSILSEIRRVTNFYLTEKNEDKIESVILDGPAVNAEMAERLGKELGIKTKLASDIFKLQGYNNSSLALLGVGIRAMFDQKQDLSLSLMPVSAREASQEKRSLLFYGGIANIIVITSLLFMMLFLGTWILLKFLSTKADNQMLSLKQAPGFSEESEASKTKKEIQEINPIMKTEASLEDQMVYFSPILKSINDQIPSGLLLLQLNFSANNTINMTGTAQSREALVNFRDLLANQTYTESVQMPSSAFSESKNINFTINLVVKKEALKK
ncbi:MAG: type IV pilus assembly protein PilM [Berkelbacteria bacterium GW2011_GWA1_39_10]|uniref:Type IV pilus assembly protein PilM n=2 Tax=Candidatus Berkelbacteria TaxID=1618330 RepID=A0A0G0NXN4_9BACT|nr:MAG: type IV pilus assembly protein PilM [Berkelbacteria bacterium GW2011_GWA1_39_10]